MTKTLYIIGNGFDLHHGIPSQYWQFGEYLAEQDHEMHRLIDEYLRCDEDDFWSAFEENLANLDTESLLEHASESLIGYGADDWSDAYHHSYQEEIDEVVRALSISLRAKFSAWITQLPIPKREDLKNRLLGLDKNAIFINFNYTPTLQAVYGIANANVFHIHGTPGSEVILGHGWLPAVHQYQPGDEDIDPRIQQGDDIINGYFKKTFKPTGSVIAANGPLFKALGQIETIFVFGHSLGDVDIPYFNTILECINASKVHWKVSYFDSLDRTKDQFQQLGVDEDLVEFVTLDGFSC